MAVKVAIEVTKDSIERINNMSANWRINAPSYDTSVQMLALLDFLADTAADVMVGKVQPKRVFKARSFVATMVSSHSNVRYTTVSADSSKIYHISTRIPLQYGLLQYNQRFGREDYTGGMSRSIKKETRATGVRRIGFLPRTDMETTYTQKPTIYIRSLLGGVLPRRTMGLGRSIESIRIPRILKWMARKGWHVDLGEKEMARMRRRGMNPNIVLAWKLIQKWENEGIKENNILRDWWTTNGPILRTLVGRISREIAQEAAKDLLRPMMHQKI